MQIAVGVQGINIIRQIQTSMSRYLSIKNMGFNQAYMFINKILLNNQIICMFMW